jgi:hypothetical protein
MNKKSNNKRYKTRKKIKKSRKKYKKCNRRRNRKIQSGGSVELARNATVAVGDAPPPATSTRDRQPSSERELEEIKSIIKSGKVYGLFQYEELKERGIDRFRMQVTMVEKVPNKLRLSFDGEHVEYDLVIQHMEGGTFVLKLVLDGVSTNTSLKYVIHDDLIAMERFVAQIFHRLDDFNEEFNMETGVNCGLMQIFSKIDGRFLLLESHPNFKKLSDWLSDQESVEGDPEKLERYQEICIKIFWQVASQLKCLRENGFYMPDFKPSNIAIIETDINGLPYYRVFLFDYGDLIIYIPKFIEKTSGILDSLRESTREKIEEIITGHAYGIDYNEKKREVILDLPGQDTERLFCNLFGGKWIFNVLTSSSNPLFLMNEKDQKQKQMVKEGYFYITTLEQAELLNLFFLSLLSCIFVSQGRGGGRVIIIGKPYIWLGYGEIVDPGPYVPKIIMRIFKQKSEFQNSLNGWRDKYKIIYDLASLFLVQIRKMPLFSLQDIEEIKGVIGIDIDSILTGIMEEYEDLIY